MVFCFRVDIDSAYGMRNGVPNILDLLRKLDIPATFFVVTGGESGLFELVRYPRTNLPNAAAGVKLPASEIVRMLVAPYNFAVKHADTLRDAMKNGHEVGCHGWKHREWTRALNRIDVNDRFSKITRVFNETFGFAPLCFAAPAFQTNLAVLAALDKFGFQAAGDLDGNAPFHPIVGETHFRHVQVPVTLKDAYTRPLIEGLHFDGYSDAAIVREITKRIAEQEQQFGFSCFYCHDVFEGINKFNLLKDVLTFVKLEGIETATITQVAKNCKKEKQVNLQ
ncbi:MAG: polysaccharide deacetylase family protein [Candidatus Micrarchaeota archaeon]